MSQAARIESELFADILTNLNMLTASQQRFIHEMLSVKLPFPAVSKKSSLKKSFGIWKDRGDITDSVEYVNSIREKWNVRVNDFNSL